MQSISARQLAEIAERKNKAREERLKVIGQFLDKVYESFNIPKGYLLEKDSLGRGLRHYNDLSLSDLRRAIMYRIKNEIEKSTFNEIGHAVANINGHGAKYLITSGQSFLKHKDEKFIEIYNKVKDIPL